MSQHLFATIVTPTAVAANNRGEGDGSTLSTLQKVTRGNDQYTTVSAEAIRWAYREYFQRLSRRQLIALLIQIGISMISKMRLLMPPSILMMTYLAIWMPRKVQTIKMPQLSVVVF